MEAEWYSYETITDRDGQRCYRIRDGADNRIATSYVEKNAQEVVRLMNIGLAFGGGDAQMEHAYMHSILDALLSKFMQARANPLPPMPSATTVLELMQWSYREMVAERRRRYP
jgi:hypothetical protein